MTHRIVIEEICHTCDGRQFVVGPVAGPAVEIEMELICPTCDGFGAILESRRALNPDYERAFHEQGQMRDYPWPFSRSEVRRIVDAVFRQPVPSDKEQQ
jgi:hypothetical protein